MLGKDRRANPKLTWIAIGVRCLHWEMFIVFKFFHQGYLDDLRCERSAIDSVCPGDPWLPGFQYRILSLQSWRCFVPN